MDSDADAQAQFDLEELTQLNTRINSQTSFPGTSKESRSRPKDSFATGHPPTSGLSMKGTYSARTHEPGEHVDENSTNSLLSFFCVITGLYILLRIDSIYSSCLYPLSYALAWVCSSASLLMAIYATFFCVDAISQTRALFIGFLSHLHGSHRRTFKA